MAIGLGSLWRQIASHPYWSMSGAAGILVFLWDRFNDWQTGSGLMASLLGPNWFAIVVNSPWFTFSGLCLAIASFWRIGTLAERGDRKQIARIAEMRVATDNAVKPLRDLIVNFGQRSLLASIEKLVIQFDASIDAYEQAIGSTRQLVVSSMNGPPFDELQTFVDRVEWQLYT